MIKRLLLIVLLSILSFGSANAAEKLSVFVSIVPQKYFVQQIGKDMVDVKIMVKPGASPATYEPKPRQMAELSKAKLYFSIGVPFENAWLKKISAANPDMQVIHTDHGIEKIAMAAHHHHEEEALHHDAHEAEHHEGEHHDADEHHGEEHHDHAGSDPHIWLSPKLVKVQAKTILKALQAADPSNKTAYEANFNSFAAKIDALDQDLKQVFTGKKGLQFMVFHPSWGYIAHDYGLKQVPIEMEGKDPKPGQLKELIKHAKEDGIKVVFVQPQFSTKSAKTVAREIGGQVAFADPLAEDWMNNLRMIAEKFKAVLK
ncbi:MAG: cation ABC transporter substrate-binding protein [Desulfobacteraceae bacterium]|nr:MAG: cation ABC transporter substrate-binding protein [Desulfobacteraceae bacterium]